MTELTNLGKMLLIVPHQDDELLLAAGVIVRAVRQGLPLHVCMVTNGDYGCADHTVGHLRLRETLNGLEYLGLSPDNVTFLGYADTGMPESESFLCKLWAAEDDDALVPSHCGTETYALPDKPSWHKQRFGTEASYCRRSLREDLRTLLDELNPDTIFTTALNDLHGDHSALCRFVLDDVRRSGRSTRVLQGMVHSPDGDERWPLRNDGGALTIPHGVDAARVVRFPLPDDMWDDVFEEHRKAHALRCHVTAMKPDAVDFLGAFVKADELFEAEKEQDHA